MEKQIEKCIRLYRALTSLERPRGQFEIATNHRTTSNEWECGIKQWDIEGTPAFNARGSTPAAALIKLEAILVQEARTRVDGIQRDLT